MNTLEKRIPQFFSIPKTIAIPFLLLGLGYIGIFLLQKPAYFLTDDLDFFLGLIFAPYIIRQVSTQKSNRYFYWSFLLFVILLFWRSNTFYFFAFGLALLFLIESFFYKLNSLAVLLLVACSAVFRHVANIWTFPIRLEMTTWTGKILSWIGFPAEVTGNIIYVEGQPFSVAPACMGLDMLVTAFVLALLVLAFFERKNNYSTPFWKASLFCGIGLGLGIFSNLIRLTVLVVFKIMPEHWMHDALGILSLVIYMVLPFFFLMRFFYGKNLVVLQKQNHPPTPSKGGERSAYLSTFLSFGKNLSHLVLIGLLWWTGNQFSSPIKFADASFEKIEVNGFKKSIDSKGVLKLENDSLLVYLKPPSRIFQGTHDPRFCWKGSGYELSKIQKKQIGNHEIYTAILSKGDDELFTAWWLDNGLEKTIGEWDWRWKTLQGGEGFRLVNVTSHDADFLENAILDWLQLNLF